MKDPTQEHLLKEILAGEDLDGFRDSSLALSLNALRRRRNQARLLKLSAAVIVPLLVICALAYHPRRQATAPSVTVEQKVKIINKEELFALFANRPIALIGKPGHQQVIFLDELGNR